MLAGASLPLKISLVQAYKNIENTNFLQLLYVEVQMVLKD